MTKHGSVFNQGILIVNDFLSNTDSKMFYLFILRGQELPYLYFIYSPKESTTMLILVKLNYTKEI